MFRSGNPQTQQQHTALDLPQLDQEIPIDGRNFVNVPDALLPNLAKKELLALCQTYNINTRGAKNRVQLAQR
jgi:hypothetical protein